MLTVGLGDASLQIFKQDIKLALACGHGGQVVGKGALCADGLAGSVDAYRPLISATTQLMQPRAEFSEALG